MTVAEIEEIVPVPSPHQSDWKFAEALPPALLHEMAAFDTWRVDEFAKVRENPSVPRISARSACSDMSMMTGIPTFQ